MIYNALRTQRFLKVLVGVGALVPILAGLAGIMMGPDMLGGHVDNSAVSLDSHYRYLSGLLMGVGIGFWTCIPHIDSKTARFQLLAGIVVLGGLGRLYSLIIAGVPNLGMLFGLGMELVVTPLLALWQWRMASYAKTKSTNKKRAV